MTTHVTTVQGCGARLVAVPFDAAGKLDDDDRAELAALQTATAQHRDARIALAAFEGNALLRRIAALWARQLDRVDSAFHGASGSDDDAVLAADAVLLTRLLRNACAECPWAQDVLRCDASLVPVEPSTTCAVGERALAAMRRWMAEPRTDRFHVLRRDALRALAQLLCNLVAANGAAQAWAWPVLVGAAVANANADTDANGNTGVNADAHANPNADRAPRQAAAGRSSAPPADDSLALTLLLGHKEADRGVVACVAMVLHNCCLASAERCRQLGATPAGAPLVRQLLFQCIDRTDERDPAFHWLFLLFGTLLAAPDGLAQLYAQQHASRVARVLLLRMADGLLDHATSEASARADAWARVLPPSALRFVGELFVKLCALPSGTSVSAAAAAAGADAGAGAGAAVASGVADVEAGAVAPEAALTTAEATSVAAAASFASVVAAVGAPAGEQSLHAAFTEPVVVGIVDDSALVLELVHIIGNATIFVDSSSSESPAGILAACGVFPTLAALLRLAMHLRPPESLSKSRQRAAAHLVTPHGDLPPAEPLVMHAEHPFYVANAPDAATEGYQREVVRAIGNLSFRRRELQDQAHALDLLPLVLNSCNIDDANEYAREWGVVAMRNLCEDHLENQQRVRHLELVAAETPPELAAMNMNVVIENGKLRVRRN